MKDEPKKEGGYHAVADKVGGVPNVRLKDNLFQAVFTLLATGVGAGAGLLKGGFTWMVPGIAAGLIGGVLLSGLVLMIVGLVRKP